MEIEDFNGDTLPFFTNDLVIDLINQSSIPNKKQLVDDILAHKKYIQWIPLSKDKKLPKKTTRVIKIKSIDLAMPKYQLDKPAKILFDIPEFEISKEILPSEDHPTHITIKAPEGFRLEVQQKIARVYFDEDRASKDLDETEHYYFNDKDHIIDVNIPNNEKFPVRFYLRYAIYPERQEQKILTLFVLVLFGISSALYYYVFDYLVRVSASLSPVVLQHINDQVVQLGVLMVAFSVGYVGLVTNPLTHKTKMYILFAIVLDLIAIIYTTK